MEQQSFFNYNGKLFLENEKTVSVNDRSFRYGEGCFETMKMQNGKILLQDYHLERLNNSLQRMRFVKIDFFNSVKLIEQIQQLAQKNKHAGLARIRLTVSRGNGGLYEIPQSPPNYSIQTWGLSESANRLNENGLVIDVYKDAIKVADKFSSIKCNNYLSYAMAAVWVKEQKLNDALLLNQFGRITDATIANVFIVKGNTIRTPALTEGCVHGVMRRFLIEQLKKSDLIVEETKLSVADIEQADEIFFTNAIAGIKWISNFGSIHYTKKVASDLFKKIIEPLLY